MGDIFRNKFFIVLLIVACVLTLATMGLNIAGHGNLVSDAARTVVQPFQTFANMLSSSVSGFVSYFTQFRELREENAELRARLAALESEIAEAQAIKAENLMLWEFYGLRQERLDFEWRNASVIAGSASNYITDFIVNKGRFHGVRQDMPVIAADATGEGAGAIVGFISEVGVRTATVSPFIRTSNSVGVYIRRTGETGIAEGDFELERQGLARLAHLSRDADIQAGDRVYSSGYGGIYPEGLFIGTVAEVYSNPLMQAPAALIEPGVDFGQIRDVMIILDFDWVLG